TSRRLATLIALHSAPWTYPSTAPFVAAGDPSIGPLAGELRSSRASFAGGHGRDPSTRTQGISERSSRTLEGLRAAFACVSVTCSRTCLDADGVAGDPCSHATHAAMQPCHVQSSGEQRLH